MKNKLHFSILILYICLIASTQVYSQSDYNYILGVWQQKWGKQEFIADVTIIELNTSSGKLGDAK